MGETADQIRNEIDSQREQLGENLQQLEQKVKQTVDWRTQFEQKPLLGLGVAFGAGLLLSALAPGGGGGQKTQSGDSSYAGGSQHQPYSSSYSGSYGQSVQSSHLRSGSSYTPQFSSGDQQQRQVKKRAPEMSEISETLDNIKGALLGIGASRLRTFLAEAVPGFQNEYEQARQKRNASPATAIDASASSGQGRSSGPSASMSGGSSSSSSPMSGHATSAPHTHPSLTAQTPGLDHDSSASGASSTGYLGGASQASTSGDASSTQRP